MVNRINIRELLLLSGSGAAFSVIKREIFFPGTYLNEILITWLRLNLSFG